MLEKTIQRLAIVNRGEPAMRVITAVRELNQQRTSPIRTIALHTEPDRHSMFVREADEAVEIGPATSVDPRDGQLKSSYLDYARLEKALVGSRADAVWVGWGFVAEHAGFADLCDRLGVIFVGPSGDTMRKLGDKITSKRLAEEAGVPVAPWSGGPVESIEEVREHAERMGYPLMLKATAGGGGRGIRRVHSDAELAEAFESARSESLKAFGDATLFMEKMLRGARHVEVQMIGDSAGNTWALGVRDCSTQRRHQKVLEETPSPALTPEQDRELREAAVRLGQRVGYRNAGTVEFLYDDATQQFSFMEVNARLQVEHPVTEVVTGVDIVKLQLHVAEGGKLSGEPPAARGHAVEVRLNAEDPESGFAPSPGVVERFRVPNGPGLRVDTGVREGDEVPPQFDSMIAKIIAHGADREEALARLGRALMDSAVVLRGGSTNKGFLMELLRQPAVREGAVDVGWLDQIMAEGGLISHKHAEVALLKAAIEAYTVELDIERAQFLGTAARGRPRVGEEFGRTLELGHRGARYSVHVRQLDNNRYCVTADGHQVNVELESLGKSEVRLCCGGRRHRVSSLRHGVTHLIEVDGIPHRISRDSAGVVRALSPSVVVSLAVKEGDTVAVGDRLAIVEAMKMETEVQAELAGRVREVLVQSNVQVGPGDPLMIIEPDEETEVGGRSTRLPFEVVAEASACADQSPWATVRSLMLGFDADGDALVRALEQPGGLSGECAADDPELLRIEDELLRIFSDLLGLFRRKTSKMEDDGGDWAGTQEYLLSFLRDLSSKGDRLPAAFVDKLRAALGHYGVRNLDRSPELEACLFRIYKAHQRLEEQAPAVMSILQRRKSHAETLRSSATESQRHLLSRLVLLTRGRLPAVHDLGSEVHYRYFHQPLLEETQRRAFTDVKAHLAALAEPLEGDERAQHVDALVACPHPLKAFLSRRFVESERSTRQASLEVLVRRYYKIRELSSFGLHCREDDCVATAEYAHEGRPVALIACHLRREGLAQAIASLVPMVNDVPPEKDVVVDLYAWRSTDSRSDSEIEQELSTALAEAGFKRKVHRLVVAISGPSNRQHELCFTYRQTEDGFSEEKVYRGVHPMVGKRLDLWRLTENFQIERLPTAEDIFLFHIVGRENPKDERLVVLAEVRDLTPLRGESGAIIALPFLERMLMESLAAIRGVRAHLPSQRRLYWNRIHLFVRPPLDLRPEEMNHVIHQLAPATSAHGLERVVVSAHFPDPRSGELSERVIDISNPGGAGVTIGFRDPPRHPMLPLSEYVRKVVRLRQRGLLYPYELIAMLTPQRDSVRSDFPPGDFLEHDLCDEGKLVPVDRQPGHNQANIVVGTIRSYTSKYPEGMTRVILVSDPSGGMGSLAEPECLRIMKAIELAKEMDVPLEWFAISAGAKISMESGTENMDWIARVLRSLVEFTQDGGEVNVLVDGINVGAQPYWNAEATMLMHTRGILVMTPNGAMVLTGQKALDYSGGVSAEDNQGIGGYERVMGPNGQAQYFAKDIHEAIQVLMHHYDLTYRTPGERFPRQAESTDPKDRDVCTAPHGRVGGCSFETIGEIFSNEKNPGRKKPFDIRRLMQATVDQDHEPLERWAGMHDADTSVVWDAHMGGYPACLIGIESRPIHRTGFLPADGPEQWTAGTLFPASSKKVARAINAASNNRPVVVLANLSGFDGSPDSLRHLQLEFGAEIGRAVVNFDGPIVFCVVSRYHGGAFVVFSNKLNENMEVAALEGAYASVIGGAPAAAVVFARDVERRTQSDKRVREVEEQLRNAEGADKARLRVKLTQVKNAVHSEKLGEVADEFDGIHNVHRAQKVGSLQEIISPERLRPYLIEAMERGMRRVDEAREDA